MPGVSVTEFDAAGKIITPGFVDGHVHLIGGGGEGGFSTRMPAGSVLPFFRSGTTTVIGLLGTDGITREHSQLLGQVRGFSEQGLNAYMLTGNYRFPPKTLTGSLLEDIAFIPEIIGFGELAISDHRGSCITAHELQRLAMDTRIAGMLSGKKTPVVLHMGSAPAGLQLLREAVSDSTLPASFLIPTHISRNESLLAEGLEWVNKYNGRIDFTAKAGLSATISNLIQNDLPEDSYTVSSDGLGSFPTFDSSGELLSIKQAQVDTLLLTFKELVLKENISIHSALLPFTRNAADCFGLGDKGIGNIRIGGRADFIIFNPDFEIEEVYTDGVRRIGRIS